MTPASKLLLLVALLAAAAVPGGSAFLLPAHPQQSNHHRCLAGRTSENEAAAAAAAAAVVSRVDVVKGAALSGLAAGLAAWGLPPAGVRAAEEGQTYTDDKYKVSFSNIPSEWARTDTRVGTNELDFRKLVVFKDPNSPANVFIAYTPVQPDFATLGSFGSIMDVAKTIVPQGRGVKSKLIKSESRSGSYFYDYTIQPDRQPERHLVTIFALIPGEALVTYTTNCLSEQYETLQPVFAKITNSFKIGSI